MNLRPFLHLLLSAVCPHLGARLPREAQPPHGSRGRSNRVTVAPGCPGGLRSPGVSCMAPGAPVCPAWHQQLQWVLHGTRSSGKGLRGTDTPSSQPRGRAGAHCYAASVGGAPEPGRGVPALGSCALWCGKKPKFLCTSIRSANGHVRHERGPGLVGGKAGSPDTTQDLRDLGSRSGF